MGYKVTLFESYPEAGGMMRYGIPEYRLPYDILDKDIDFIISLGVELKTNTRVGTDVTLESLHSSYDSVLIATGLHQGRSTGVPGTDNPMVFQSIDLLAKITKKEEFPVEEKMVVIGGGNVALDIARSLARKQKAKYGKVNLIVTSLESRDIMPADEEEIVEGMEEGIEFHPGRGPEEIVIKNNKIVGLKTSKCTRVFDEEGRFSPEFDKDDIELYEGVMVVESIGQAPDMSYLGTFADSIEYDGRRIKVDEYYQSSENWLFVIGDIIKGPDVITGIATGHTAAQGVDNFLRHIEADGITKIDDILRIAYSYQKDQLAQITQAEETASGKPELEELAGKLDTLKNQELSSLEILDALLVNPDTRIHLRQELPREILKDDFAYITNLESLDMSSGDTISSGVISRLSAAYALYNDLIQLTRSKELKFSLEILRGRNDQSRKVFS